MLQYYIDCIKSRLAILTDKERLAICLRLGLGDLKPKSLKQAEKGAHLTYERIRQLEIKAYKKIAQFEKDLTENQHWGIIKSENN